ncbi:MAG: ribonuclease HI [Candidatus Paceibacterota bacterium]
MNNISIFTDGSSRGNPGPGGWGSVIVSSDAVVELGGGEKHTTNNRMELQAAISALESVQGRKEKIIVHTDSSYVVNGITKWVFGWEKKGWMTMSKEQVQNRDLWEKLLEFSQSLSVEWKLVPGHSAVAGNERCDEIATGFADGAGVKLFNGPRADYSIKNILDTSFSAEQKDSRSKSRSRSNAKAYSYVSMVGGEIKTHATWIECESRVRGKSGVRYKKALSSAEEQQIISEFKSGNKK